MRRLKCLVVGVLLGFIAAHLVNQTPRGRRLFEQINSGIAEFKKAFAEGYHDTADASSDFPATSTATAGAATTTTKEN